jgi:hypothetical protein
MAFVAANHSKPVGPREWTALQGISLSHFYKLRRTGLAPECVQVGTGSGRGRLLITPEATVEWLKSMANRRSSADRVREIYVTETRTYTTSGIASKPEFYVAETVERDGLRIIGAHIDGPFQTLEEAKAALARLTGAGNV